MVDLILIVSLVGALLIALVAAVMLFKTTKKLERAKSEMLDHGIEVGALRAEVHSLKPFVEVRDAKLEAERLVSEAKEQAFQGLKSIRQRCDEILADAEASAETVRAACRIEAMRILETVNVELEARAVPVVVEPAVEVDQPVAPAVELPVEDRVTADAVDESHIDGSTTVDTGDEQQAEERVDLEDEMRAILADARLGKEGDHPVEATAEAPEAAGDEQPTAETVEETADEQALPEAEPATVEPAAWSTPQLAAEQVTPFASAPEDIQHTADDHVDDAQTEAAQDPFEVSADEHHEEVGAEEVIVEINAPSVVSHDEPTSENDHVEADAVAEEEAPAEVAVTDQVVEDEPTEIVEPHAEAHPEDEAVVADEPAATEAEPAEPAEEVHVVALPSLIDEPSPHPIEASPSDVAHEETVEALGEVVETVSEADTSIAEDTQAEAVEEAAEQPAEPEAEEAAITAPLVDVEPIKVSFEGGHKIEDIAPVNMLQRIFKLTLPVSYVDVAVENDGGWPAPMAFSCAYDDPDTGARSVVELAGLLPFVRREGVTRTVQSVSAGAVPGFPSGLVAFGMGSDKNQWFALDYRADRATERPAVVLVLFKQIWKPTVIEVAPDFDTFLDGLRPCAE